MNSSSSIASLLYLIQLHNPPKSSTFDNFPLPYEAVISDYYTGEAWYKTDVLVYATSKNEKTPLCGIDLANGWGLSFQKKWYWQKDDLPLYKKLTVLYANTIIMNKACIFKTKVKGVNGLNPDEKAAALFKPVLERFPGFEHYGHTLFFNRKYKVVGWFRSGNTADLLIGGDDKKNLDGIIEQLHFSSAKYQKVTEADKG